MKSVEKAGSVGRVVGIRSIGLLALLALPAMAGAAPLKFMPLGDSITQGGKGIAFGYTPTTATVGYRYPLYYMLKNGGYDVDFVGTQKNIDGGPGTNSPNPAHYPLYNTTFDRDNQGHWGKTAAGMNSASSGYSIAASLNTLAAEGNLPDVVLLHLGTNDLTGLTSSAQLDTLIANMTGIITKLRAANPNVKVFVSTIDNNSGVSSGTPYQSWMLEYNRRLATMVTSTHTPAAPVYLFDLVGKGFNADTMTYDALHMNKLGEDFTASAFYDTLVTTGAVPEPTALAAAGLVAIALLRRRRA